MLNTRIEQIISGWYTEELQIHCVFSFDTNYPVAVDLTFKDQRNVTWTAARDLIAAGLFDIVGEGDMVVGPYEEDKILFILRANGGQAEITFDKGEVARFLHATFLAIPRGSEFTNVDWDAELTNLTE